MSISNLAGIQSRRENGDIVYYDGNGVEIARLDTSASLMNIVSFSLNGTTITVSPLIINALSAVLSSSGYVSLSNPVWDDLRVPLTSVKLGGSKDPGFAVFKDNGSGSQGVFVYFFDKNTDEEVYFACQIPHEWKKETSLHPHVHWVGASNGVAGRKVSWGLEYSFAAIGGTFGNSNIIYTDTRIPDDAAIVAGKHYLSSFSEIATTGITTVSPMILCRLFRDATSAGGTDDYDHDAGVLEFDFHYQIDSLGSNTEYA